MPEQPGMPIGPAQRLMTPADGGAGQAVRIDPGFAGRARQHAESVTDSGAHPGSSHRADAANALMALRPSVSPRADAADALTALRPGDSPPAAAPDFPPQAIAVAPIPPNDGGVHPPGRVRRML